MATAHELLMLGWRHHQEGAFAQAELVYRQVLQNCADCVEAWFLLGGACQAQGRLAAAEAAYRQTISLKPHSVEAHYSLGNVLAQQGQFPQAAIHYREVVTIQPAFAEAHNNLGVMLAEQRQFAEALACYNQALVLKPDYAEAHYNLANGLKETGRLAEAAARYRQALQLKPSFAEAHLNLGITIAALGKPAEAVVEYHEALRLQPHSVEAHNNLGLALAHLGHHEQALARYQRALQLWPDFPDAHYNLALTWLTLGNFEQGWAEYEWRWRLAELPPRPFSQALWDGTALHGRTILLHSEQGMGDTIQFIRYAPLVQQRGGKVLVECQGALLPLLAGCAGIDQLVARGAPLPSADVHCPLMSLGRIFAAGLAPIPANVPYVFTDPRRFEHWRSEVSRAPGFKVGIAWQGSPGYRWDRLRSIPLAHFAPLARVPGVQLISLQKGPGTDQLGAGTQFDVIDLGNSLDEGTGAFVDTAAVMKCLDLVVTSDTAVAHLAGALALPVWLALSLSPEWRWQLHRADSPWYPTMRLFRQMRFGDWDTVFSCMAVELRRVSGS
jgi:tetratricopeptide (TPR) repeat protein